MSIITYIASIYLPLTLMNLRRLQQKQYHKQMAALNRVPYLDRRHHLGPKIVRYCRLQALE